MTKERKLYPKRKPFRRNPENEFIPYTPIQLLNIALYKLEKKWENKESADTTDEFNWNRSLRSIHNRELRDLLRNTYDGVFVFWNDPQLNLRVYDELGQEFTPFFQTYISGYCHDLIRRVSIPDKDSRNFSQEYKEYRLKQIQNNCGISISQIVSEEPNSAEYYRQVVNFIDSCPPLARGNLSETLTQEYPKVIQAFEH